MPGLALAFTIEPCLVRFFGGHLYGMCLSCAWAPHRSRSRCPTTGHHKLTFGSSAPIAYCPTIKLLMLITDLRPSSWVRGTKQRSIQTPSYLWSDVEARRNVRISYEAPCFPGTSPNDIDTSVSQSTSHCLGTSLDPQ